MTETTCSSPDCDRPILARGMCRRCYERTRTNGSFEYKRNPANFHTLSDVDSETRLATCRMCGPNTRVIRRNGQGWGCAAREAEKRRGNYRTSRNAQLLKTYGITLEQYEEMAAAQDNRCAVCRQSAEVDELGLPNLRVDHCHTTGAVRGLLCDSCNLGLGKLGDTAASLRLALAYLEAAETPASNSQDEL